MIAKVARGVACAFHHCWKINNLPEEGPLKDELHVVGCSAIELLQVVTHSQTRTLEVHLFQKELICSDLLPATKIHEDSGNELSDCQTVQLGANLSKPRLLYLFVAKSY